MNPKEPIIPRATPPIPVHEDFHRLLNAMAECQAEMMVDPADSLRILTHRIVPTFARVTAMMVAIDNFFARSELHLTTRLTPNNAAPMSKGDLLKLATKQRDTMKEARELLGRELEQMIATLTPPVVTNTGLII